jgi:hypothetical protein
MGPVGRLSADAGAQRRKLVLITSSWRAGTPCAIRFLGSMSTARSAARVAARFRASRSSAYQVKVGL